MNHDDIKQKQWDEIKAIEKAEDQANRNYQELEEEISETVRLDVERMANANPLSFKEMVGISLKGKTLLEQAMIMAKLRDDHIKKHGW